MQLKLVAWKCKAPSPKILKSFLEKKARMKKTRTENESNEKESNGNKSNENKSNEKKESNKNTPDVVDAAPQAPPGFSKPPTATAQTLDAFEEMMSLESSLRSSQHTDLPSYEQYQRRMSINDFFSQKVEDKGALCAQRSDYIKCLLGVKPLKKDPAPSMSRGRDEHE
jgi:hypothetical protein